MEAVVPYLLFNGNAKEAFDFYANALGGKIVMSTTFGEAPAGACPAGQEDKIMHAVLQAEGLTLMCSDCPPEKACTMGDNISMSMNFTDDGVMDKTFNALAEGGTVTMALQDTFWGARFGMLKDKFGTNWMFNHDKAPKQHP